MNMIDGQKQFGFSIKVAMLFNHTKILQGFEMQ